MFSDRSLDVVIYYILSLSLDYQLSNMDSCLMQIIMECYPTMIKLNIKHTLPDCTQTNNKTMIP